MKGNYTWQQRREMAIGWAAARDGEPHHEWETIGWRAGFRWYKKTNGKPLPPPQLTLSEEFSQLKPRL